MSAQIKVAVEKHAKNLNVLHLLVIHTYLSNDEHRLERVRLAGKYLKIKDLKQNYPTQIFEIEFDNFDKFPFDLKPFDTYSSVHGTFQEMLEDIAKFPETAKHNIFPIINNYIGDLKNLLKNIISSKFRLLLLKRKQLELPDYLFAAQIVLDCKERETLSLSSKKYEAEIMIPEFLSWKKGDPNLEMIIDGLMGLAMSTTLLEEPSETQKFLIQLAKKFHSNVMLDIIKSSEKFSQLLFKLCWVEIKKLDIPENGKQYLQMTLKKDFSNYYREDFFSGHCNLLKQSLKKTFVPQNSSHLLFEFTSLFEEEVEISKTLDDSSILNITSNFDPPSFRYKAEGNYKKLFFDGDEEESIPEKSKLLAKKDPHSSILETELKINKDTGMIVPPIVAANATYNQQFDKSTNNITVMAQKIAAEVKKISETTIGSTPIKPSTGSYIPTILTVKKDPKSYQEGEVVFSIVPPKPQNNINSIEDEQPGLLPSPSLRGINSPEENNILEVSLKEQSGISLTDKLKRQNDPIPSETNKRFDIPKSFLTPSKPGNSGDNVSLASDPSKLSGQKPYSFPSKISPGPKEGVSKLMPTPAETNKMFEIPRSLIVAHQFRSDNPLGQIEGFRSPSPKHLPELNSIEGEPHVASQSLHNPDLAESSPANFQEKLSLNIGKVSSHQYQSGTRREGQPESKAKSNKKGLNISAKEYHPATHEMHYQNPITPFFNHSMAISPSIQSSKIPLIPPQQQNFLPQQPMNPSPPLSVQSLGNDPVFISQQRHAPAKKQK